MQYIQNTCNNLIGGEKNMEVSVITEFLLKLRPFLFISSVTDHRKTGTETGRIGTKREELKLRQFTDIKYLCK